jgi:WD40 repeat protein
MNRSRWYWLLGSILLLLLLALGLIWRLPDPRLVHTFMVDSPVSSVAIDSHTSVIAARSRDDVVRLWNLDDMTLLHTLRKYPCITSNIAFQPDRHHLAVGYGNGAVLLWDVATGEVARTLRDIQPLPPDKSNRCTAEDGNDIRKVLVIAFSPDGTLVAISGLAQPTSIIDTVTGSLRHELQAPPSVVRNLTFSPDRKLLASSGTTNVNIHVWNTDTGQLGRVLEAPDGSNMVRAMLFADNGRQLLAGRSSDSTAETWSLSADMIVDHHTILNMSSGNWDFAPQGDIVAAGGQGTHGFFSHSGLPFWGGRADPTVYIGNLNPPGQTIALRGHQDYVTSLAFSTDGDLLVSGSEDGTVRLWRVPEFEE